MPRGIRRPVTLAAGLALLAAGCAPQPRSAFLPDPPSEDLRNSLGRLAVRAESPGASSRFLIPPRGWAEGLSQGFGMGAVAVMGGAHGANAPFAALVVIALIPVGGVLGAVYGAFAALPAEAVNRAVATLEDAAAKEPVGTRIAELSAARLREVGGLPVDDSGPDTVLSIGPPEFVLTGAWSHNPDLRFFATVEVRLVRAADGAVLHSAVIPYVGSARELLAWAASGGAAFRAEIRDAADRLAESMIDYLMFMVPMPARPIIPSGSAP